MFNFICFGSGSSGNCYLLQSEDGIILIDAGIGIRSLKKHFQDNGLSFSEVKAIFVTHDHADHIKAVGSVSVPHHIPVYATRMVHNGMMRNYRMPTKLRGEDVRVLEAEDNASVAGFSITSFSVPHDASENVGYFIQKGNTTFCLATDVGKITPEIKKYISKTQFLVLEANYDKEMLKNGPYPPYLKERIASDKGHLCNEDTGKVLVEESSTLLKRVWLCHLSEENNHPELALKTVSQILAQQAPEAYRRTEITALNRRSPSPLYNLEA